MLQIIITEHLPSPADVKALSRTCRALHGLIASPAMVAAWLWRMHGAKAPFKALGKRDLPVLRQLIDVHHADVNGPDAEGDDSTLLWYACRHGIKADFASYLLTVPGIDVNKTSENLCTPLHQACASGQVDCVRQLLSHPGVQVNALDGRGETPLDSVLCSRRYLSGQQLLDIVCALFKHPSFDMNAPVAPSAMWRWDPLTRDAIIYMHRHTDQPKVIALLLQHPRINVNATSSDGNTSLHVAVDGRRLPVVRELLKHPGIDLGLRNRDGQTAHQVAEGRESNEDVVRAIAAAMVL